jgi:hypothetical protein
MPLFTIPNVEQNTTVDLGFESRVTGKVFYLKRARRPAFPFYFIIGLSGEKQEM